MTRIIISSLFFVILLGFSLIQYGCSDRDIPVFENPQIPGSTELKGQVSGILSKSGSPYFVKDDIYIESSDTLYIEPGVELQFENDKGLTVNGTLFIYGDKEFCNFL